MNETTMREIDFALAVLPYIGAALVAVCAAVALVHILLAVAEFISDERRFVAWRIENAYSLRQRRGRRKRR